MSKKVEKVLVNGKSLTAKEKMVLDKLSAKKGYTSAIDLQKDCGDLTLASVRSTMARLEKTHGLLVSHKELVEDKVATTYKVKGAE